MASWMIEGSVAETTALCTFSGFGATRRRCDHYERYDKADGGVVSVRLKEMVVGCAGKGARVLAHK